MQTVLFKSLSHKNSTEREREEFLKEVKNFKESHYVLLNTCNRVEFYYSAEIENETDANDALNKTVAHLASVGAGMDSFFIGEQDIKFQIKNCYADALLNETTDRYLNFLFQHAMRISKLVRTKTGISEGAVSHSTATVKIIESYFSDLSDKKILILGAHRMNHNIIKHLKKRGANAIIMSNRTYYKALHIAEEVGCEVIKFDDIYTELQSADILITATSCPHELIRKEQLKVLDRRLLIIDLGFPSDVEKSVDELDWITRYDLKRVEQFISSESKKRELNLSEAERIVEEEAALFVEEVRSQDEKRREKIKSCI